jgi:hypothetical protein
MKNIQPCCGCFNCWIKTPGKCVIEDDYTIMPKLFIENDAKNNASHENILLSPDKMSASFFRFTTNI